jgi:uncharacterized protein YdhG (YjbR/CyaY superfamily)
MASVIDEYIAGFEGEARERLTAMRDLIREVAPEASEKLAYGCATWDLNGNMVHIAGFARHVSLFPTAAGVAPFVDELGEWTHTKGTIQFPLDRPLPLPLIRRIVEFRAAQQRAKKPRPGAAQRAARVDD